MTFPKRTFEKPIPISPLIALDRERCILCYRCTRFSESVAEDGQLVAINRGAQSMIATFEDEPYRGRFSGNVIELCPVGALTSTQYRFEARPWEIQNVPTVCGLCPVGCNISATTREGKVKRILSRNHPEVDEGWLCDKGRFAFAHLHARRPDRRPARARPARAASSRSSWDDALDEAERLLRAGGAVDRDRALRRRDGRAGLRAREAAAPAASARTPPCCRRRCPTGSTRFRAPLSAIRDAKTSSSSATSRSSSARRSSTSGSRPRAATARAILYGAARRSRVEAPCSSPTTPSTPPGSRAIGATAAFYLPRTPNGRGVADAWSAAADGEPDDAKPRAARSSRATRRRSTRPCARSPADAEVVIGIGMFEEQLPRLADLVLPGTSYLERDGTTVNLEGRLQRQRRAVIAPCPDELAWIAKLAERFGVELSPHASRRLRRDLGDAATAASPFGDDRRAGGAAAARRAAAQPRRTRATEPARRRAQGCASSPTGRSSPAPRSSARPSCSSSGRDGEIELARADARARGIRNGRRVTVSSNGTSVELRARIARDLAAGTVRIAARPTPAACTTSSR